MFAPPLLQTSATVSSHTASSLPSTPPRRRRLPSSGFVAVCATYLVAAAFLAWGFSTPPLERVWTLHHELKIGKLGAPNGSDRKLVQAALHRHADLAHALLPEGEIGLVSAHNDGWIATPEATIVRTPAARDRVLKLDVETPRDLLPFTVDVRGDGWRKSANVTQHGSYELDLPAAHPGPELILVRLKGRDLRDDPSVLGVRISFAQEHGS